MRSPREKNVGAAGERESAAAAKPFGISKFQIFKFSNPQRLDRSSNSPAASRCSSRMRCR